MKKLQEGQVFKNYKDVCEWLGVTPSKGGNSRNSHIKEFERYCKYHKDGNKFVVDEVFEDAKDKEDNRFGNKINYRDEFSNYTISEEYEKSIGVYCIVKGKNIYVGSTCKSFRERFSQHEKGYSKQKYIHQLLKNGGVFQILWVSDVEDEYMVRMVEQMYIDYFMASPEWILINKKEETICLSEKTKYKNKTIKIDERQYELAIKILRENGIFMGGEMDV